MFNSAAPLSVPPTHEVYLNAEWELWKITIHVPTFEDCDEHLLLERVGVYREGDPTVPMGVPSNRFVFH
jgi:hypothetical protein